MAVLRQTPTTSASKPPVTTRDETSSPLLWTAPPWARETEDHAVPQGAWNRGTWPVTRASWTSGRGTTSGTIPVSGATRDSPWTPSTWSRADLMTSTAGWVALRVPVLVYVIILFIFFILFVCLCFFYCFTVGLFGNLFILFVCLSVCFTVC